MASLVRAILEQTQIKQSSVYAVTPNTSPLINLITYINQSMFIFIPIQLYEQQSFHHKHLQAILFTPKTRNQVRLRCSSQSYRHQWWWWLFPLLRGLGETVRPYIPRLRFFVCFVLKWRVARSCYLHAVCQGQSKVAQRADTTVIECSRKSCVVSSFPDSFPQLCLGSGIVSPFRLSWVKGVCVFRWNLRPALLAK